jgi:phage FluMu protein Com
MSKPLTLADFTVPIALRCAHCNRLLLKKSPAEISGEYVIVQCRYPNCGCMTPFKLESAA